MSTTYQTYLPRAEEFCQFVHGSQSSFHAVENASRLLSAAGFQKISEKERWDVKGEGKYFYTRNQSSLVAFAVGGKYESGNGVALVGAHTDSPNFLVKPNFNVQKENFHQIAVECYGGGLWPTWFDRDLTLAGRVIVKTEKGFESKLLRVDRPILRIPTLAIHLDREAGTKLEFNKQTHLLPVIASIQEQLGTSEEAPTSTTILHQLIASELKCKVEDIQNFELSVCDYQKPVIGGVFNEFIFSPRLDNLMMSFCSLTGLIEATKDVKSFAEEKKVWSVVLFDNEEVGSQSAHGAGSPIVEELVRRLNTPEMYPIAIRNSFLVSADMAHAAHPNYAEKHDPNHKPRLHKGPVIKHNANQKYATTAESSFLLKQIATRNNIPFQDVVVRNDSLCGSTIGPIIAAKTGIRTVDIGNPQLSMHSIREMCGTADVTHACNLLKMFFLEFTAVDAQLHIQ